MGKLPALQCHFSGDYEEAPWWRLDFDQEYQVKSVKLFNINNGAQTGNLGSSKIYIGDKLCAIATAELPVNEYVKFECEDENYRAKNVFGQQE